MAAGAGALVLWSAMKGASVTGGLRSLLTGKQPSAANTEPIAGSVAAGGGAGGGSAATGSAIADAGLRYVGAGGVYRWGGGALKSWDCSGFVNYVVGHDLGSAIPGSPSGAYSGHGPTTIQWALFGTSVPRSQVEAGDLVVWPLHHMGIAISGSQMVNCPGPNGTPAPIVSSIDENIGGPRTFRRLSTAMTSATSPYPGGISGRG